MSATNFISGSVLNSESSAARLWKLANTVLGHVSPPLPSSLIGKNGLPISDPEALVNNMNNFFVSKIELLMKDFATPNDISHPTKCGSQPAALENVLFLSPPSPTDIVRAIVGLNKTDATGPDGITVSVLKLSAPVIVMPLAHMIGLSISQGRVPKAFKSATVVPIHKGKGKPTNQPSSYRPVVILPALSKVLEKVVLMKLIPFLESRLPECQFGFRPARSASAAVATAHEAWAKATSAG